jgi:3-hydroxybutyrate dehydrogenase
MSLKDKTALVTGSTQGLGLAFARALAAEGCNVTINGLGDAKAIEEIRSKMASQHGVQVHYSPANMAKPEEIEQMLGETVKQFGDIDILVNNAVTRHIAPIEEFPVERWNYALAVNLSSVFHTVRLSLPAMRRKNWGRIINLSSVFGTRGLPNKIDYATTKHALIGFTRSIALETATTGITVNAICPGWVLTPHSENQIAVQMKAAGCSREEAIAELASIRQPTRRIILPEKVAALAVFLCSEGASDITGASMSVDGGWSVE